MKNFYEILEVDKKASSEIIEKAYKTLVKKYHPDLHPDDKEYAEEQIKLINDAYDTLSDTTKREEYDKIYLITSAVQSEEEIGMLPGSVNEKLYPSMMSFRIVIEELIGKSECDKLFEQGYIEYMPISYLRGVNLRNCIVLGDELQNLTIRGMKTLLTRISYNAKFIIMGDTEQIDRPKLKKETSGLHYIIEKLKENPDEKMGIVEFGEEDVVRNPIINTILNLFGES